MAKQLFFGSSVLATTHRGNNDANLAGTATWWRPYRMLEVRGAGVATKTIATVAGPTNGIEVAESGIPLEWISEPLSADFTISGTITANLWMFESTMNDNVAGNFVIDKIDGATGALTQIVKSARVTEEAVTTSTVANFTATPTSTACKRGDRLRMRIFGDDAGTMASAGLFSVQVNGTTAGAAGDSYIQFTENLTFEPAGDPGSPITFDQPLAANPQSVGLNPGFDMAGQAIVAPASGTLNSVRLTLSASSTPPGNLVVEIQSDSAGTPSGTVIGTVTTVTSGSVTTTPTQYTFSCSIALTPGTTYWVVLRATATSGSIAYSVGVNNTTSFMGGNTKFHSTGSTWGTLQTSAFAIALVFIDPTLIADQVDHGVNNTFGSTGTEQFAQPFVAQGSLKEVRLWLALGAGSPSDNVIVEIQTDNAGVPSGTVVGTAGTIAASSLTGLQVQYTFTATIPLTVGATYHVVIRRSGSLSGTNTYTVATSTAATVSGWSLSRSLFSGSWTTTSHPVAVRLTYSLSIYYLTDTTSFTYVEQTTSSIAAQVGTQTSNQREAVSFVADGTLTSILISLNGVGTPGDNLIIEVQSDSSGSPSGTVIGTIANVAASTILTTGLADYLYTCSIALSVGTTYWIVLSRSGSIDISNFVTAAVGSNAPWGVSKSYNGSTWTTIASGDLKIRITPAQNGMIGKKALTTPGSGSVNAITNTATGPTAGIQTTVSAGGTAIEWYTPPLNAFSLGGKSKFNIRCLESSSLANASLKAEIAIVAGDGSGAVVWGSACVEMDGFGGELATADLALFSWVSGDDTAITSGQRLRFRIYVDDVSLGPLVTGFTATVSYNGATPAAAGDTYVILPQKVTEQIAAFAQPIPVPMITPVAAQIRASNW